MCNNSLSPSYLNKPSQACLREKVNAYTQHQFRRTYLYDRDWAHLRMRRSQEQFERKDGYVLAEQMKRVQCRVWPHRRKWPCVHVMSARSSQSSNQFVDTFCCVLYIKHICQDRPTAPTLPALLNSCNIATMWAFNGTWWSSLLLAPYKPDISKNTHPEQMTVQIHTCLKFCSAVSTSCKSLGLNLTAGIMCKFNKWKVVIISFCRVRSGVRVDGSKKLTTIYMWKSTQENRKVTISSTQLTVNTVNMHLTYGGQETAGKIKTIK